MSSLTRFGTARKGKVVAVFKKECISFVRVGKKIYVVENYYEADFSNYGGTFETIKVPRKLGEEVEFHEYMYELPLKELKVVDYDL